MNAYDSQQQRLKRGLEQQPPSELIEGLDILGDTTKQIRVAIGFSNPSSTPPTILQAVSTIASKKA